MELIYGSRNPLFQTPIGSTSVGEEIVAGECVSIILHRGVYQNGILTVLPYGYAIW